MNKIKRLIRTQQARIYGHNSEILKNGTILLFIS